MAADPQLSNAQPAPPIDAGAAADFDPWADPNSPPHPQVDVEQLTKELAKTIRRGLPLTQKTAGSILPNLRSVVARSVHPYDPQSRIQALNQLLVRLVIAIEAERDRNGLMALLAFAKGTRGTTLDHRRQEAAAAMGYDPDHLRKRIEPQLLELLAEAVYDDLLRYKRRVRRAPTAEEPTGDTPMLTDEHLTHQEELISRIWQHVYGLRAELIASARLAAQPGYESQAEDHRQAAGREMESLRMVINEFKTIYGEEFIRHGDAEYAPEALERLVNFVL